MGPKAPIAILLMIFVTIEALRAPVGFTRFKGLPRSTIGSRAEPDVVLAEFPFYSGDRVSENGPYASCQHALSSPARQRLQRIPAATCEARAQLLAISRSSRIATLRALGVTHVTVPGAACASLWRCRAAGHRRSRLFDLQLAAKGGIRLYRLSN